jgi:hypothetical protein
VSLPAPDHRPIDASATKRHSRCWYVVAVWRTVRELEVLAGNGIGEPIWSSDSLLAILFHFLLWRVSLNLCCVSQYVSIARKLLYSFRDGVRIEQGRSGSLMARSSAAASHRDDDRFVVSIYQPSVSWCRIHHVIRMSLQWTMMPVFEGMDLVFNGDWSNSDRNGLGQNCGWSRSSDLSDPSISSLPAKKG